MEIWREVWSLLCFSNFLSFHYSNQQYRNFSFSINHYLQPTVSIFQLEGKQTNPTDITKIFYFFKFCSEKFFLFFFSAVIFSLALIHSRIAGKELSIQITFCGGALECLHSILFKTQFVFCVGQSFVYCVCMYVFVLLACSVE